jgi:hypothetical protein
MAEQTAEEKEIADVEKVLGEPVFLEFSEPTLKARRNLLAVATIAAAFWWWDLALAPNPTVMGVQLQNFSGRALAWGFLWAVTYLLGHFVWLAWDALQEWRLRISGTRLAYITTARAGSEHADAPNDPRQSTLYGWWLDQHRMIGRMKEVAEKTTAILDTWANAYPSALDTQTRAQLSAIQTNTSHLATATKNTEAVYQAMRVPVSLERFEAWFLRFQSSQNCRWILLEFGVPTLLGLVAIYGSVDMLRNPVKAPPPAPVPVSVTTAPAKGPLSASSNAASAASLPAPAAAPPQTASAPARP